MMNVGKVGRVGRVTIWISRSLISCVIGALAICAACATARPSVSAEGEIELGKITPVLLGAGTYGDQDVATLYWVTFTQEDEIFHATIRSTLLSYPKSMYEAKVTLLDKAGKPITSPCATFENDGTCVSYPFISESDLHIDIGPLRDPSRVQRYRITLATAPEDAEANARITGIDWTAGYATEKGDRTIDATIVDPEGKPTEAEWFLWRGEKDATPEPIIVLRPRQIRPVSDGMTWRAVYSCSGRGKAENLAPGIYRVRAFAKSSYGSLDPTPVGISEIIDLKQQKDAVISVQLKAGQPLTIETTADDGADQKTLLLRPDGFPVETSLDSPRIIPTNGTLRFRSLEPGRYTLMIGERDWWYALYPESVKVVTIDVKAVGETRANVPYVVSPWRVKVKHAR